MYGWRGRLGLVIPSANTVNEPEFYRYVPDGVSVHTARMELARSTVEGLEQMTADIQRCGELLATADVDAAIYGCTTGSLFKGPGYAEEVERKLGDAADAPAVATAASVRRAFEALDVETIAVTTPYIEELNERLVDFFEDAGVEVSDISGLGFEEGEEIVSLTPERAYREVQQLDCSDVDAVFISCTGYRTFETIEALEDDLEIPVVTSNQATLWDALRTISVDYSSVELGRLFDD